MRRNAGVQPAGGGCLTVKTQPLHYIRHAIDLSPRVAKKNRVYCMRTVKRYDMAKENGAYVTGYDRTHLRRRWP